MSTLLQKVRVLDPVSGRNETADVFVADGTIAQIAPEISDCPEEAQVRDGQGLVLGPGLVDLYSHSGEPGFEDRETLLSLMEAGGAGGFTRIAILPDTAPPVDNQAGLSLLQHKAEEVIRKRQLLAPPTTPPYGLPKLQFWGALTVGVQGAQMTEVADLAIAPVVGFADGYPLENLTLLRRILEYLQPLNLPIALWPCSRQLVGDGVAREGNASIRLGLPGNPGYSETAAIAAILELVGAISTPVHLMRVSTQRSVELIREAKSRGYPITASTTWMHLLLNTESIGGTADFIPYDPSFHLAPPLGNPHDQEALIQGVRDGAIDAIAIDHTPYTYEEKTVAFAQAPPGAIGLEFALPLLWQNLVESGKLSALELWRALSTNPAICLQQTPPSLSPGNPAEMLLFDPLQGWSLKPANLQSLARNTPWFGREIVGRVLQTWCPETMESKVMQVS